MVRAGYTPDGSWYLGRGTGRGVWWCAGTSCEGEIQMSQVAKALRSPVTSAQFEDFSKLIRSSVVEN